jgi:hypothetical protein
MKKTLVFLVGTVFLFSLFAPSGCGGDKAKAQQYMESGDSILLDLSVRYAELGSQANALIAEYGQGAPDPADVKAKTDAISNTISDGQASAEEAGTDYTQIMQLRGVQDYAQYAEMRLEMLRKLNDVNALLEQMLSAIEKSTAAGEAPDPGQLQELANQIGNTEDEMSALDRQASDFKSKKDL